VNPVTDCGNSLHSGTDLTVEQVEARLQKIIDAVRAATEARSDDSDTSDASPGDGVARATLTEPTFVPSRDREPPWAQPIDGPRRSSRFGQLLLTRGLVTVEELDAALAEQQQGGRRIGETLVEIGAMSSLDMARALAEHLGMPFVDLDERPPDLLLATLIPEEVARRYRALAVERWSGQLVVAMASPNDVFALDDLRVLTGYPIIAAVADAQQLGAFIERAFQRSGIESTFDDAVTNPEMDSDDELFADDANTNVSDGPIIRLVNALLEQAITDRASDLHVEPTSTGVNIRMRVDGILHDTFEAPLNTLRPLVSRLKVMGGADIAQSRTPQDGRFSLTVHDRVVDVRLATMPTAAGESAVLRLLDPVRSAMSIESLGLTTAEERRFVPAFMASQGAVFITGPTGSGKSSTAYAVASAINRRDRSIISVEDPVEYRIDGIKQVQINRRAGMTFASALRSTLRVDPDVILIGEVRDAETARIAADASITGHLVLSTLHTTRAAATPVRLVDMGVEPYLVASALSCIVAQRLVRKPCEHCARELEPDLDLLRELGADDAMLAERPTIRSGPGCTHCLRTGYRGRAAVFEIMPVTEDIAHLIITRAASSEIERLAVEQGMDTLRTAALRRVVRGELTVDEMLRVVS